MSDETSFEGEVRITFTIDAPHHKVDRETLELVITDALNARFGVRPRESAPVFELHTEVDHAELEIYGADEVPQEFNQSLDWFVETKERDE